METTVAPRDQNSMPLTTGGKVNSQAALSPTPTSGAQAASGSEQTDFESFMDKALGGDPSAVVNEEELYANIIEQRLSLESSDAADYYHAAKDRIAQAAMRPDGYVSWEDVSKTALKETVAAGKVSEDKAAEINGLAFQAAQLDDHTDVLWDGRGSDSDPTVAIATMSEAMFKMKAVIDQADNGELTVNPLALDSSVDNSAVPAAGAAGGSTGAVDPSDGDGGFLWKPASEQDGHLLVMLPESLAGQIQSVDLYKSVPADDSSRIASGAEKISGGDTRPTFNFDKPGADYGKDIYLVVHKIDGSDLTYLIADGSQRID